MNIEFKEFNLILTFLWNRVGRKEFKELLEIAIGHELPEGYVDEKWGQFRKCPAQFLHNFENFFKAVCAAIEAMDYKG